MRFSNKGFTLIELMVTVAVLAVVLALAVPSFNQIIVNNRSLAAGAEFTNAINYARVEAVKRAQRVSLCASSDGATCLSAGNWSKGWLVFLDNATTDSGTPVVSTVLRYWKDLPVKLVMTGKLASSSTDVSYLRFTTSGTLARGVNESGRQFKIYVTGCKSTNQMQLNIGIAGLISPTKISCP